MGVAVHPAAAASQSICTDQRDIESELSKLLGEDGVSEDTANMFH